MVEAGALEWPALAALRALTGPGGAEERHEVLCVGGAPDEERLQAAGIVTRMRLGPARGPVGLPSSGLARVLQRLGPFDCVHAWTAPGAARCVSASPGAPVVATVSTMPTGGRASAGLRRALDRAAHLRFTHRSVREAWQEAGAPTIRSSVGALPVEARDASEDERRRLRQSWGVPEGEPVVLACGAPTSAVNARWFSYEIGVMSVAGLTTTVVIPDGAAQCERGVRFAQRHREPWRVVFDRRPVWEVAPGADLALWSREGVSWGQREGGRWVTPPDSLAWAAAAGLPVVCEDHEASREALTGLERAVRFVSATRPTALIDEVMETIRSGPGRAPVAGPAGRDRRAWVARTEELLRSASGRLRPLAGVSA